MFYLGDEIATIKLMPQLRQNIITGEWVVIAPERAKRPSDFVSAESPKPSLGENCPFCLDNELYKKESLSEFETKDIYVIPNSFPAFVEDPQNCSPRSFKVEDGFYTTRPSTGGHDVIIIKKHNLQIFGFAEHIWEDLFLVAKRRYSYYRKDCNVRYSMLIYNQGARAGASIYHPHAQLMASNIIPNQISKEIHGSQSYFEENGTCVFCDLLAHEKKQRLRVVEETESFLVFTFYAARFPFETWVVPKRHSAHFEQQQVSLLRELGQLMKRVIGKLDANLKSPALNFYLHDSPATVGKADYFHWHLEIVPRVSTYGGYELGSGTIIDVLSPEEAAKYLRQKSA